MLSRVVIHTYRSTPEICCYRTISQVNKEYNFTIVFNFGFDFDLTESQSTNVHAVHFWRKQQSDPWQLPGRH